jgi:hypothetical protein
MIDFAAYIETLAISSKDIGHSETNRAFYRAAHPMQMDEVIQGLGGKFEKAVVVFTDQQGRFEATNRDQIRDRNYYSFAIIGYSKIADYSDADTVKEACMAIARKFMSKIKYDALQEAKGIDGIGLRFIDWNSVNHQAIGPIADNCYGAHWSFTIIESTGLIYEAEDWDE